jgi:hypothetical protein
MQLDLGLHSHTDDVRPLLSVAPPSAAAGSPFQGSMPESISTRYNT